MAALQVLRTAELLEQILTHLDMKTLLLSQQVDTFWRDSITKSPSLQKKLFFKPVIEIQELLSLHMLDDLPNGTLAAAPRTPHFCYCNCLRKPTSCSQLDTLSLQDLALANPLFSAKDTPLHVQAAAPWRATHRERSHIFQANRMENTLNLNKSASWRKMLLTQPAQVHEIWTQVGRHCNYRHRARDYMYPATAGSLLRCWDYKGKDMVAFTRRKVTIEHMRTTFQGYLNIEIELQTQRVGNEILLEKLTLALENLKEDTCLTKGHAKMEG